MMNKSLKRWLLTLLFAVALAPAAALAEDIDLYAGTGGGVAAPNVLFYLDNTSNWSSSSQQWAYNTVYAKCSSYSGADQSTCQGYVNQIFCSSNSACSGNPGLLQGQVELRALKLVLNQVVCNPPSGTTALNINAGLMLLSQGATGTPHGSNESSGYIRHAIASMSPTSTYCTGATPATSFMADLSNIDQKISAPDFKTSSSPNYGTGLYEAFKYFGGYSRPSLVTATGGTAGSPSDATHFGPYRYGYATSFEDPAAFTSGAKTTYQSPISASNACGNNFIILIGNTWPNKEYDVDANASPYPTSSIMGNLNYDPGYQLYPKPLTNSDKTNVRFADEWAKFLYDTDVSSVGGKQNVRMFTIDVYNSQADAKQSALLQSMAKYGQGGVDYSGYFSVGGDLFRLINSLKNVLTQIAAVNSVFASASLPVSVNAQGTYLNQVFMGVFRPDANGRQRWAGNLKQYQFGVTNGSLFLADATGAAAVDSVNTGFIQNCAVSFWTTDSTTYWQSISGTQSACTTASNYATSLGYSDLPDGPIVERGGAGEMLRNFSGGYASRNIRTCSGISCKVSGAYSLVDFNTTNVTIPSTGLSAGTTSANLVNWARGQNLGDGTADTSGNVTYNTYASAGLTTSSMRPTVHGEVVHSRPLAINYGTVDGTGNVVNDVAVFYGAGDGLLHAVNGNQSGTGAGSELWAFIAPEHWSSTVTDPTTGTPWNVLDRVHTDSPVISYPGTPTTLVPTPAPKTYFFDGSIGAYQERTKTAIGKVWIYPTMRRGGNAVYAFDATNKPGTGTSEPTLLWKFGCASPGTNCATGATGESSIGQTWSTPLPIRIQGRTTPLVVFGAGYDVCEDDEDPNTKCTAAGMGRAITGTGIYVMDAQTGSGNSDYTYIGVGTPPSSGPSHVFDSTAGRFVADLAASDVNGDGYIDVIYALDTRGNVWRINTSNPASSPAYQAYAHVSDWPVVKVATVGQWGTAALTERRKFMYAPSLVSLGSQITILVGTGDREKPSATSNAAQVVNRFYGIRDDITQTSGVTPVIGYGTAPAGTDLPNLLNVTGVTSLTGTQSTSLTTMQGWFMNLDTTTAPFEQVVTRPLTIGGVTYFSTFQAKSSSDSDSSCQALGTGRAYQVSFQSGTLPPGDNSIMSTYLSGGIPPSPVGGLVDVGGTSYPFCIGCVGPTSLTPTIPLISVAPNRKPIYRFQRGDN